MKLYLMLSAITTIFNLSQSVSGLRILGLFPTPANGHFVMCEALMRGMAERGHKVDVYGHFPLKSPVDNYKDYSLVGTLPIFTNNMSYEFMNRFADVVSMPLLMEIVGHPVCELLNLPIFQSLINNPPGDPPYDIVVIEMFLANCYLAFGRHLNVPIVTVVTTTLFDWMNEPLGNPTNLAVEPSNYARSVAPMSFFERLNNYLLSNSIKRSFNYNVRHQDKIVERAFGPGYPDAVELQRDISLTLVNYHHYINGIRSFTPAVIPVGGIHVFENEEELPKLVQRFVDESKDGFIYFSFGSMVQFESFPKADIEAVYATFKKIAPVRVLIKIADPKKLPEGLPSNVITCSWLPQVKVLKHKNIIMFVTHGGLMGTLESIYFGVPMIGFPLFGDQHFNIESYVKKNIAINLDRHNIKEETFTEAVRKILDDPKYKNAAKKAGDLFRDVPMNPMDAASFWIEYIASHGKHALQSPLVNMPWWQASLFDVYGLILAIFAFLLLMLTLIVKMTLIAVCSYFRTHARKMKDE